jgi:DNA-binding transcriptional regulator YiaG
MTPQELKTLRAKFELTIDGMVDLLGCSRRAYIRYEQGQVAIPGPVARLVTLILINNRQHLLTINAIKSAIDDEQKAL